MKSKVIAAIVLGAIMVLGTLAPAFAEMDDISSVPDKFLPVYHFGYESTLNLIIAGAITCDNAVATHGMLNVQFDLMVEFDKMDSASLVLGQLNAVADIYNQVC